MVYIKVIDFDLEDGIDIISTTYEVSTHKLFLPDAIVCSSKDDKVNKTNIIFNDVLDPTIKYYARAKMKLSTGMTIWGNITIFIAKDINEVALDVDLPSRVSIPIITSSGTPDDHPVSLFKIFATGYSVIGDASHDRTSWIIEDSYGKVVWTSLDDKINKVSIEVNDILLEGNKTYRIRALFISTSNDVSQVATKTFVTNNNDYVTLLTSLSDYSIDKDKRLVIAYDAGLVESDWELYVIKDTFSKKIWSKYNNNDNPTNVVVPKHTLQDKLKYVLKIKTNLHDEWKHIPFTTY